MRAAVAGANAPTRPLLSPAAHVQLQALSGRAPGGAGCHPARGSGDSHGAAAVHASAARGIATPRSALPYADAIQRVFGRHDVSSIAAHIGGTASRAARDIGAEAFATGNHVVFDGSPSLHTAAHEAAHVVQQRAGVHLKDGVGAIGDAYERHADAVADAVVQGRSAEALLDTYAVGRTTPASAPSPASGPVQGKFFDGLASMPYQAIRAALLEEYDNVPQQWRVEALARDNGEYRTIKDVAAKLGLKSRDSGPSKVEKEQAPVEDSGKGGAIKSSPTTDEANKVKELTQPQVSPPQVSGTLPQVSPHQVRNNSPSTTNGGSNQEASAFPPGLHEALKELYAKHHRKPSAKAFAEKVREFVGDDAEGVINHPAFAWEFMELVREQSGTQLDQKIERVTGKPQFYDKAAVFDMPWKLRHYTTVKPPQTEPPYNKLKSTLELNVSGIAKSQNTNNVDWHSIGNVGFTFYLLCIDGEVPERSFLSQATHYAEFDFETIPQLFVSGDMLAATAGEQKQPGLRGSGIEVKQKLCSLLRINGRNPESFLKALDSKYGNFEVKVPGQLVVKEWKRK